MMIVYGGERWYLADDGVHVHPRDGEPRRVADDDLPLPVARVLLGLQDDQAA
jgi:hypothetical protein